MKYEVIVLAASARSAGKQCVRNSAWLLQHMNNEEGRHFGKRVAGREQRLPSRPGSTAHPHAQGRLRGSFSAGQAGSYRFCPTDGSACMPPAAAFICSSN